MPAGDFTIPDNTGAAAGSDLTTLFGVAQGVAATPVVLKPGTQAGPARITATGRIFEPVGSPAESRPLVTQQDAQGHAIQGVLNGFYSTDKPTLENLQRQLYAGGFYSSSYYGKTPKTPQFGTTDDDSFAAFKSAAIQAARSGKPLPDVLNEAMASTAAGNGPGAPTAGTPTRLTSPTDIRAAVIAGARAKYGHKADEAMVHDIISQYQSLEAQAQESTSPRVTQAPDLSTFVGQQLQQANPREVALNDALHASNLVMQAFGAPAGATLAGSSG